LGGTLEQKSGGYNPESVIGREIFFCGNIRKRKGSWICKVTGSLEPPAGFEPAHLVTSVADRTMDWSRIARFPFLLAIVILLLSGGARVA
jgi:hypothetical protein